jgi:hypothetical protein
VPAPQLAVCIRGHADSGVFTVEPDEKYAELDVEAAV